MRKPHRKIKKLFYAVQFIELPFEGIDDYICVPNFWIVLHEESDQKVLVRYPRDEHPFVTKERVKRREKCSNDWKYYMGIVQFESDNYENIEQWIAIRNDSRLNKEKQLETEGTQPKYVLDRKLRSSIYACASSESIKPQLTVKTYENPRNPMLKISIKRPIQLKSTKKLDNKRLKLEADKITSAIDSETMIPECSKKEQSIIKDNQFISHAQPKTVIPASNGEMSSGQRTLLKPTQENESVVTLLQSTSTKLPCEKQPSLVCQDYKEAPSMPVLDIFQSNVIDGDSEVQPEITEKRSSSNQTPSSTLEPSSQPLLVNEKPSSLVHSANLPQEPCPQETSTDQSNGINDNTQQTQLLKILTTQTIVSEPTSAVNQPSQLHQHTESQYWPIGESSYSNPQPRETDVGRSTEVIDKNQKPRSQNLMTKPSTFHHIPNLIKISSQPHQSTSKKPSSSVIKNLIEKKSRIENIPRYTSNAAQHLQNQSMQLPCSICGPAQPRSRSHLQVSREQVNHARYHNGGSGIDQRFSVQSNINNTLAAQNFSNVTYHSRFPVEQSHERQHLPTQEDYLQQIAHIQDLLRRADVATNIDQRGYIHHSMINGGFIRENQANLINPINQFLPRPESQSLSIDRDHMQYVLRPDVLRRPVEGSHAVHQLNSPNVGINIPFAAQNSSNVPNQSHPNVVYIQKVQNSNYKDPKRDPPTPKVQFCSSFNSKSNSQRPEPQKVMKITSSSALLNTSNQTGQSNGHGNYLVQDPCIQVRLNQILTEHHSNLAAVPQNITIEPMPTTQDSEVQTMSSEPSHETQYTLIPENHVYRHPRSKKLVVDRFTTMDFSIDRDHCDETIRSPVIESSPNVVDSECQTDNDVMEELPLSYQEVASDHEDITGHEIAFDQEEVSDNDMSTDVSSLDTNNKVICTEASPPQNNTERPTTTQNFTLENQQMHPRFVAEQQMLNIFATLFTQMGANVSYTCDMFNNVRNSILESAKTYQLLLETVQTFNSMGDFQIAMAPSNNVTMQIPQAVEERPAEESKRENSGNGDENTNSGVSNTLEKTRPRFTFVLPPEYDPNDSKWTLKYKKKLPGLVELMPRSGIYVKFEELKRCIRKSKDCKMLARLLLTEVFSKNALSVCSLTGGKAKAFNTVDVDVRPGLDAHARMVLLAYVEEYGLKRKWNTSDTQSIINSIRSKIREMRAKYS